MTSIYPLTAPEETTETKTAADGRPSDRHDSTQTRPTAAVRRVRKTACRTRTGGVPRVRRRLVTRITAEGGRAVIVRRARASVAVHTRARVRRTCSEKRRAASSSSYSTVT